MADPLKRIADSRTQQYWTSISSSISNTTSRLRVNIFNPPLPAAMMEKAIEVNKLEVFLNKIHSYESDFSFYSTNDQHSKDNNH